MRQRLFPTAAHPSLPATRSTSRLGALKRGWLAAGAPAMLDEPEWERLLDRTLAAESAG